MSLTIKPFLRSTTPLSTAVPSGDLIRQLQDPNAHVQLAGLNALLSKQPSLSEIEGAVELSTCENEDVRMLAARVLGETFSMGSELSENIFPHLISLLRDASFKVVEIAAKALSTPSLPEKTIWDVIKNFAEQ